MGHDIPLDRWGRWLRPGLAVTHNSEVSDDASDGRPWPIDPARLPSDHDPRPFPELGGLDDVTRTLSGFAGSTNGEARHGIDDPVTDDDRTRYGVLLDHAAERGLLTVAEYEVRIGELAEATTIDEMRRIVTELPAFTPMAPTSTPSRSRSRRAAPVLAPDALLMTTGTRRRNSSWVVLALVVAVMVALLIAFTIYAEHLSKSHTAAPTAVAAVRTVSAPHL
jgi:hypothetical protein